MTKNTFKIVLDTNILVASISTYSPFNLILKAAIDGNISLCVSTDILLEYDEIITRYYSKNVASLLLKAIEINPSTLFVHRYYSWNLIHQDPDDNKFVDCFIAASADFLMTHDKHFEPLKQLGFPKINLLSGDEFLKLLMVQK
jgi:putative PIN family toxin of toxin-antitoxin system